MVIIFFFFGYQKWFQYEAQALIPYINNGPLGLKHQSLAQQDAVPTWRQGTLRSAEFLRPFRAVRPPALLFLLLLTVKSHPVALHGTNHHC